MGKSNKPNDARGFRDYGGMTDVQNRIDELQGMSQQRTLTEEEQQELQYLNYQKPSFGNNLQYFFGYQLRYMYLRYFMWNFVGRFNDQQAVMGNTRFDGNWYSGIPFVDRFVVGPSDGMPDYYKNQKAKNAYFFLPLLLGILGLLMHLKKRKYDFWLVMTLFLFTGILINVYMNQPPYEPRERDYALVGSFQTFCIWVGLGVLALADMLQKRLGGKSAMVATAAAVLLVPVNMGYQNWDDHDRSGRTIGIDMAKNFLENLEPNAVLFCNGDNDTYPLWYAQNVEGIRTDVRIINQSLLPTDWYSSVLLDKVYESEPLPLSLTKEDLQTGSFEGGIEIQSEEGSITRLDDAIKQVLAENKKGVDRNYFRARKVWFPVDRKSVIASGLVAPKDTASVVDRIEYSLGGSYISKGDLLFMDLLTQNAKTGWKRPIYFTSVSGYDFFDMNDYLQLEGLVYKLVPIKGGSSSRQPQRVADYKMYSNLVKNFKYYGMKEKKNFFLDDKAAYVPGDLQQMSMLLARTYLSKIKTYEQYKEQIAKVGAAGAPVPEGYRSVDDYMLREKDSLAVYRKRAIEVLNHILIEIPEHVMPMRKEYKADFGIILLELGDEANAKKVLDMAVKDCVQYGTYFVKWEDQMFGAREVQMSGEILKNIAAECERLGKKDWAAEYKQRGSGI